MNVRAVGPLIVSERGRMPRKAAAQQRGGGRMPEGRRALAGRAQSYPQELSTDSSFYTCFLEFLETPGGRKDP